MNTSKTLSEVCRLLGINNRQLDRLLVTANINKQLLATDSNDQRKKLLTTEQIDTIRALISTREPPRNSTEPPQDITGILARLERIEAMIRQFQQGKRQEQPPAARPPASRKRIEQKYATSDLPSGYISYFTWAEIHHIPASTTRGGIVDGRIPTIKGPWKHHRNTIKEALDSEGQQAAFDLWHHRADFQECEHCPNHHEQ